MSWNQATDPLCTACATTPAIEMIIEARKRALGGFSVARLLPSARRKLDRAAAFAGGVLQ